MVKLADAYGDAVIKVQVQVQQIMTQFYSKHTDHELMYYGFILHESEICFLRRASQIAALVGSIPT